MRPHLSIPITPAILAACEEADAWMKSTRRPGHLGAWLDAHREHPQIAAMERLGRDGDHDNVTWQEVLAEVRRLAQGSMGDDTLIPYDPATLAAYIAKCWPGIAECANVKPDNGEARLGTGNGMPAGALFLRWRPGVPEPITDVCDGLLLEIKRSIEDAGYIVDKPAAHYVVLGLDPGSQADPGSPAFERWFAATRRKRAIEDAAAGKRGPAPDAKREHGRRIAEMARRSWGNGR